MSDPGRGIAGGGRGRRGRCCRPWGHAAQLAGHNVRLDTSWHELSAPAIKPLPCACYTQYELMVSSTAFVVGRCGLSCTGDVGAAALILLHHLRHGMGKLEWRHGWD